MNRFYAFTFMLQSQIYDVASTKIRSNFGPPLISEVQVCKFLN